MQQQEQQKQQQQKHQLRTVNCVVTAETQYAIASPWSGHKTLIGLCRKKKL